MKGRLGKGVTFLTMRVREENSVAPISENVVALHLIRGVVGDIHRGNYTKLRQY